MGEEVRVKPTEKEARAALEILRAFCQREIIVEECREVRAEGCYSCDTIRFFEIMDDVLPTTHEEMKEKGG